MSPAEIRIIHDQVTRAELAEMARARFGEMVKDSPCRRDAGRGAMNATTPIHAESAARWHTLTLMEQLAHVGSEVERAIRAYEGNKQGRFESALARALDLFDLTATDERWRGARCREVLRAREEFCRLFFDEDVSAGSARGLRRYFLAFATAARSKTF